MDRQDLNSLRSVDELEGYQREVRGRIGELNNEFAGLPFPEYARTEYAELRDEDDEIEQRLVELRARQRDLERMARSEGNSE